jgi:hypothetical protein
VAPTPSLRRRSKRRSARIAVARRHNREQRPINEARRRLEDARRQELAECKFRNHMRDMLALFKGTPSTSPFCTWINDPREREELPPDWTPDLPAPQFLPDHPKYGPVGKRTIEDTGPLNKKRMETIDDEIADATVDYIKAHITEFANRVTTQGGPEATEFRGLDLA